MGFLTFHFPAVPGMLATQLLQPYDDICGKEKHDGSYRQQSVVPCVGQTGQMLGLLF